MVNVRPAGQRVSIRVAPGSMLDRFLKDAKLSPTEALHRLAEAMPAEGLPPAPPYQPPKPKTPGEIELSLPMDFDARMEQAGFYFGQGLLSAMRRGGAA